MSGLPLVPPRFVASSALQLLLEPTFKGIFFKLNHNITVIEPVSKLAFGLTLILLVPAPVELVLLLKVFKFPELPIEKFVHVQVLPPFLLFIICVVDPETSEPSRI